MIDGLIAGKLQGKATERTSKNGKPYALAKVRAAGGDGEALFVNVIAFDTGPCAALLALGDGDAVALAGTLTPKAWLDREGQPRAAVDMVASQVLSAYHVRRKREAVTTPKPCTTPAAAVAQMEQAFGAAGQWDDGGAL
ncbi:MAG: single-stranded DNA-binding protein [Comamonas sp.]|nr:single-stranded DNA-binding protein [Comamonas sp.]